METIRRMSSFSRTMINDEKMGAYYTDLDHCRRIHNLLSFPQKQEVACLEPSIGNGEAIFMVTGAKENPNIKVFGVELNAQTCEEMKENPYMCELLHADFLTDTRISNNVFSFCFGNPPYMADPVTGERMERRFLDKVVTYLKKDAVLVWVIPYSVFKETPYLRAWIAKFTVECIYRFDDKEFEKYKQIVIIGRKKHSTGVFRPELERVTKLVETLEDIPYLPQSYDGKKIAVDPSEESKVVQFTNRKFDSEKGLALIRGKDPMGGAVSELLSQKQYQSGRMEQPPIPLKPDSKFLCMVCGKGEGYVECDSPHLQRGVVRVVEEQSLRTDKTGKKEVVVISSSKVSLLVVEQSGVITKVE